MYVREIQNPSLVYQLYKESYTIGGHSSLNKKAPIVQNQFPCNQVGHCCFLLNDICAASETSDPCSLQKGSIT